MLWLEFPVTAEGQSSSRHLPVSCELVDTNAPTQVASICINRHFSHADCWAVALRILGAVDYELETW